MPETMLALVKEGASLGVQRVPRPRAVAPGDIVVRVGAAGICRTDLYVAQGRLRARDPIVPGHEFAGIVAEIGPGVRDFRVGERVTAAPWIACGRCASCAADAAERCARREFLGVDRHGAFAEFVVVPDAALHRIPDSMPLTVGAYVEPVAAALAVLNADIDRSERGLVFGHGRIARLTHRILVLNGFRDVELRAPESRPEPDSCDFAIETFATAESLAALVAAVRPGGRLVLKSRPAEPVPLDVRAAVHKRLTLQAVDYGPFPDAIELLRDGRVDVGPLLGPLHALAEFEAAFAAAACDESAKHFLLPAPIR